MFGTLEVLVKLETYNQGGPGAA